MRPWFSRITPTPAQREHAAASTAVRTLPIFETLEHRQMLSASMPGSQAESAALLAVTSAPRKLVAAASTPKLSGTYTGKLSLKQGKTKLPASQLSVTITGTSSSGRVSGVANVPGVGMLGVEGAIAGKKFTLILNNGTTAGSISGKVDKKGVTLNGEVHLGAGKGKLKLKNAPKAAPVIGTTSNLQAVRLLAGDAVEGVPPTGRSSTPSATQAGPSAR